MKSLSALFALSLVLSLAGLSSAGHAANYLDAYASATILPYTIVNVTGGVYNTSNQGASTVNVSASVGSGNISWTLTNYSVSFGTIPVNASFYTNTTRGMYSITVLTNDSTVLGKTITIFLTNVSSGSITYVGSQPPFQNGTTFNFNISTKNSASQSLVGSALEMRIFAANGQQVSGWTITNSSAFTDVYGVLSYSVAIPTNATSGQYIISVDYGRIISVFEIKSGYTVAVMPQTLADEKKSSFARSESVNLLAKVRSIAGNPATGASVTAHVTVPNGTVVDVSLTERDSTNYPGYYNNTFADTTQPGSYSVKVDATAGTSTVYGYMSFNVRDINVQLSTQNDFFRKWGGSAAFATGDKVGLNIIVTNLTTGNMLTTAATTTDVAQNCSSTTLVSVFYPNGTIVAVTGSSITTGQYLGSQICRVQFNAPSASGTYGVRVNVTVGAISGTTAALGESFFSVQKYMLKPTPVSGLGGDFDFMTMVYPGDNATFQVTAFNLTSGSTGAAVAGANITNIKVNKITPMMFGFGSSEIANFTEGNNYFVSYGSTPTINLVVPGITGPMQLEIQATVGGETVTGTAFFLSKYVMGFMNPGGATGGGPEGGFSSCTGTDVFSGTVRDIKANQGAQGAVFYNILDAREEMSGKDISSCLTLTQATSDSNGQASVNISYSPSCSLSGAYFAIVNVSYNGKTDGIPAGFMCKRLNFWPNVRNANTANWMASPTSPMVITITNITRQNDSSALTGVANVTISRITNFDPAKGGGKIYTANATNAVSYPNATGVMNPIVISYNMITQAANFTIYPQNFSDGTRSLTQWPSGFIDIQPQVTATAINGLSDTSFAGFKVVPFDAWIMGGWGSSYSAGQTVSYTISAKANLSSVANVTSVKIGRPWQGSMTTATLVSSNNTQNFTGSELWNVTFTIPATINKGQAMIQITLNNTNGETNDVEMFTNIVKYAVTLPREEDLQAELQMVPVVNGSQYWSTFRLPSWDFNTSYFGWNMTNINATYNVGSASGAVCIRQLFNTTQCSGSGCSLLADYDNSTSVMMVDNATAGVYNTLLVGKTNTKVINAANRNITTGLYFWSFDGCGFVKLVNSNVSSTNGNWAGSYQANREFAIPYVVNLNNIVQSGVNVSINGVIKQNDQGGTAGKGFQGKLAGDANSSGVTVGNNYSYTLSTTDALGIAFVKLNVMNSGMLNVFWRIDTAGGDYDIASMSFMGGSGTNIQVRSFQTSANRIYWLNNNKATLLPVNSSQLLFGNMNTTVYNGTITGLIYSEPANKDYYVVYDPLTNKTWIDDDLVFYQAGGGFPKRIGTFTFNATGGVWAPTGDQFGRVLAMNVSNITGGTNISFRVMGTRGAGPGADVVISERIYLNNSVNGMIRIVYANNTGNNSLNGSSIFNSVTNITDIADLTGNNAGNTIEIYAGPEPKELSSTGNVLVETNLNVNGTANVLRAVTAAGDGYANLPNSNSLRVAAFVNNFDFIGWPDMTLTNTTKNVTVVFYEDGYRPTGTIYAAANSNVSFRVCAETFDRPSTRPIEGASVQLYAEQYGFGPPQKTYLTLYSPLTDTVVSSVATGPGGCAAFKATYSGGWPAGTSFVQGEVTRGANTEQTWVAGVTRI